MEKPLWLKPNTIIHHPPTQVVAVIKRLQQQKGNGTIWLVDCEQGDLEWEKEEEGLPIYPQIHRFALEECVPATRELLSVPRWIFWNGFSVWLERPVERTIEILEEIEGTQYTRMELEPTFESALYLSHALNGTIICEMERTQAEK